jgi:hypothetical protein
MTANTGKGANGKPGQRSTGADATSGSTAKKTSAAAKPPSDEVTLRTSGDDDTNGSGAASADDAEETVVDMGGGDETLRDIEPPAVSDEDASTKTSVFEAPDPEATSADGQSAETPALEATRRDDSPKPPAESGEVMPSSGRSASMDAPTPQSHGYGSPTSVGSAPASGGMAPPPTGGPSPRAAAGQAIARFTDALRRPERTGGRKPPRKAHLQVARFEPWSVMKFSFIMSLVCFLVLFVAVTVLYIILSWLGVFDALSNTIRDLTSNDQGKSGGINPANWFSATRILGYTALIGALNVLLITALATVWSVIYNMAADLVGGVEVTLKEADQ